MQLVIVAGGKGTRLKGKIASHLPKPMVDIGGMPLLEHQIVLAQKHGIGEILILTGHGGEHIENYFGDGSPWGTRIRYQREDRPRGTAGAVLDCLHQLEDTFFVMYGDTMLNVDLSRMAAAHTPAVAATLFVHPNDHPHDSDLVEMDETGRITAFHPYPHPAGAYFANRVNAALYLLNRNFLSGARERFAQSKSLIDFAKDLFPALIRDGAPLQGYLSREYIKDAGTPARLDRVRHDYLSGRIAKASFETPAPAVFLDRDGTLNVENGWLNHPDQITLLPGAAEAVRAINQSGYLAVIVTNQPVVARGECTEHQLHRIHDKLEWLLGKAHAYVDAIYYCPHHPHAGYPGERPDLKITCTCRKPETGLLQRAAQDLNIDLSRSWMIGDRASDIQAAAAFGIRSALVRTGFDQVGPAACKPDIVFDNVLDATRSILNAELVSA